MKEEFYSYSQMALGVEVYFTRIGDFTWRVSDCEELVGGYSQGNDGVGFGVFISLTLLLANLQMGSVNYGIQGLNFTC